jgi:hypothetical protein
VNYPAAFFHLLPWAINMLVFSLLGRIQSLTKV